MSEAPRIRPVAPEEPQLRVGFMRWEGDGDSVEDVMAGATAVLMGSTVLFAFEEFGALMESDIFDAGSDGFEIGMWVREDRR